MKRAHHYLCLLKTVKSCIQGSWIGASILVVDRDQTDNSHWSVRLELNREDNRAELRQESQSCEVHVLNTGAHQCVHGAMKQSGAGTSRKIGTVMTRESPRLSWYEPRKEWSTDSYPGPCNKLTHLILLPILWERCCPHSADRQTEAQRG